MNNVKLFTLPYAGGLATVYTQWKRYLSHAIELIPVELAGRGKRINCGFYKDFPEAVADVADFVTPEIKSSPYALFGHSMGSLIIFELLKQLQAVNLPEPVHVFFSGRNPPHVASASEMIHQLSDDEFIRKVFKYGGTPLELIRRRELLELFLPVLRADYRLVENYRYSPPQRDFGCAFTILTGREDPFVNFHKLHEWGSYTSKICNVISIAGNHFFIKDHMQTVVDVVNETLENTFLGVMNDDTA